ncbi:uncharacterized protein N7477_002360 [Penicillium maclennaniae]|uniref:uncharacterized protein n=1 Tax=Penicillium maclennaniae TaxID=1343394 RepID=UPI00253FDE70|nr:uncharacterized protein N7477_002360 [Penicillium maclennaniae]KAJ5676727.1 hypothetical protein N7477_002360 [Penicillium maclennaniae]
MSSTLTKNTSTSIVLISASSPVGRDQKTQPNLDFCENCQEEGTRQMEEIQIRDAAITELRDEIARLHKIISFLQRSSNT